MGDFIKELNMILYYTIQSQADPYALDYPTLASMAASKFFKKYPGKYFIKPHSEDRRVRPWLTIEFDNDIDKVAFLLRNS